ncbi:cytidine deaminase [Lindgomyces ingoldianus]|uniref:Cytidine deaminase n=1 Tax=Lindgomyces ingoldianus TaxID=673940 RepID=A0ACB6QA45_9PLEO|nr:cytidine deaminase [Lindgomyces ingoldianus]KAF2463011.1 cytidine deaminase [Lindgomyces ingoldianus]
MSTAIPDPVATALVSSEQNGLVHGLSAAEFQILSLTCIEAKATAYCPYSLFRVGASLLINPNTATPSPTSTPAIITGANVENASYPVGTCAERVAMGTAVIQGHRIGSFKAIGVATDMDDFCSPCGMCRQYLREFCENEVPIFMFNKRGEYRVMTLGELLPMSFGPDKLPSREVLARGLEEEGKTKVA